LQTPASFVFQDFAESFFLQTKQATTHPKKQKGNRGKIMRVCFLLKVKETMLEEYKVRHAAVWPEMLDALSRTGWHNYSLFMRKDGLLVGYLECEDFKKCCDDMQLEPINAVWQKEMTPFFEALGGAAADESMIPLAEVFHLA